MIHWLRFYQIVGQFGQFCAVRATSSLSGFDEREQLAGGSLAGIGIVHAVNPFLSGSLEVGRRAFGSDGFFQDGFDAGTHLLVGQGHTHAVFAEVLKQGVRPSRTLSLLVRRVRCGRNGTGVDRRTTRGVGHDFAVSEELRNQLHIRSFAAARASARELEERSGEL